MRNWRVPVTFTLSLDGKVTSWSEGVRVVLGYDPDEFLGKHFEILFTADDISNGVPERLLRNAMENGSAALAGWRLDKDGVRRFARGEMSALHGPDQEIVGLAVVFQPSAAGPSSTGSRGERRGLPAADALEPEMVTEIFNAIDERFYVLDDEFDFVYVNAMAAKAWKREPTELIGRSILDAFPELQDTELLREHLKVANERVSSRFATESPLTGERVEVSIYPRVTGGLTVLVRQPFTRDESGRGMLLDDRLTEAYAALEIAVIEWEPEGVVWRESPTTSAIFGLTPDEGLHSRRAQLDVIMPSDVESYLRTVESAVAKGEDWRCEYRIVRPLDGEIAWIEENGTLIEGEEPQRYSVLAWDITPTRLAEEQMRSSQRRLQQELSSNRRLQEIMSRTARADEPQEALAELLGAAMELLVANQGTLRVLAREEGVLRIVAQRRFDPDYLTRNAEFVVDPKLLDRRFGQGVNEGPTMVDGEGDSPDGLCARDVLEAGGYRERWAPLIGLNGHVVGLMALHWRRPRSFSDRDEHDLAVLVRQAGVLVEAYLNEQRTQILEDDLKARMTAHGAELMESEIRFRRAFEGGPIASCITTVDEDRFIEVNSGYVKLTGYQPDEVVGRTSRELGMWSSPQDQAKLESAFEVGGAFHEIQLKLRTADGRIRDILLSGERISYNGQDAWLKMFNDVTEQHRSQEELMEAIRAVMSDSAWFGQSVVQKLAEIRHGELEMVSEFELTARERQVLELVAAGLDDEQIAEHLGISQKTVRNHLSNTYAKTEVHSRAEAIVWARDRGIVART